MPGTSPGMTVQKITQNVRGYAAVLNEAGVELAEETTQIEPGVSPHEPDSLPGPSRHGAHVRQVPRDGRAGVRRRRSGAMRRFIETNRKALGRLAHRLPQRVIPGLVPGIHPSASAEEADGWMVRTSPNHERRKTNAATASVPR